MAYRLIRVIGVIVPRRLRADWRQEWEAELRYREMLLEEWDRLDWRSRFDLLRCSLGAFIDAVVLQPRRLEDEMFQDLRYGARLLWRSPALTLASILSLAIGIGATSAIFSIVNGVVLRPLPYEEPERLVRLWHSRPQLGVSELPVSGGNVEVWRERAQSFDEVAVFHQAASVFADGSAPEQIFGAVVSANLLPMLGYQPLLGRGFLPEDEKPGSTRVILLSHQLWQRRFGGDPNVIGRRIIIDHTNSYTVVGVMPPQAIFPGKSEFWRPENITAQGRHDMRSLSVMARLKPGVTAESATGEVRLIHQQLLQEMPENYKDWGVMLQPLHDSIVGRVRPALLVLLGAVGCLLLIACANVANLLLVRASARQKEIAVRAALGAARFRLIRQLLTESALLALLGGAGGLLLAFGAVQAIIALEPPGLPRLAQVNVDGRVIVFTILTTLLVGLIFGLAPAINASRPDLNFGLKEGLSSGGGRRWFRGIGMREVLVVAQTAMAFVLLVGAGLLIRSFIKLRQVELGFEPSNAVVLMLSPPFNRFKDDARTYDYYQRLLDELKATPGVEAVGATTVAPSLGAYMSSPIVIAGRAAPESRDAQQAFLNIVSPDYFRAIGNQIRKGRLFNDGDNESAPRVAIINEKLARSYFGGEDPLGQRIALRGEPNKQMEIVGVTADHNQFGLSYENKAGFYVPFRQKDTAFLNLVVRTAADPSTIVPALRERILGADKYTAISRVQTLDELVSASVAQPRFYTLLLAIFGGIALALAVIGVYGVMAYSVSRRRHEIGIRMALGAEAGRIERLIVGRGMLLVGAGVVIGLVAARVLTRVLEDLLFGVKATDPATFAFITGALALSALLACWLPARRAAKVDPLAALRCE